MPRLPFLLLIPLLLLAGCSSTAFVQQDLQSVVQILVMGLVAVMVIMMVVRPLVKRALEVQAQQSPLVNAAGQPAGLLAAPGVAGALPAPNKQIAGGGTNAEGMIDEENEGFSLIEGIRGPTKPNSIKKINEVIDSNPDEAVQIIRAWMYGSDAA